VQVCAHVSYIEHCGEMHITPRTGSADLIL
jgi:hypothetical protein